MRGGTLGTRRSPGTPEPWCQRIAGEAAGSPAEPGELPGRLGALSPGWDAGNAGAAGNAAAAELRGAGVRQDN